MKKVWTLTYINTENKIAKEVFNNKEEALDRKAVVKKLWDNSTLAGKVSYYAVVSAKTVM